MPPYFRLPFLLLLLSLRASPAPAQRLAPADSLRAVLARTTTDTAQVRLLLKIGRAELAGHPDQALAYARQALALARQRRLGSPQAKALLGVGRALHALSRLPEALHYFEQARALSQRLDLPAELGQSYQMIGVVYAEQGRTGASEEAFRQALAVLRPTSDHLGTLRAYNNLGFAYQQQGKYADALHVYLQGLTLAKRHADNPSLATLHVSLLANISGLYGTLDDDKPTLDNLLAARRVLRRFPNDGDEFSILVNLGAYYYNHHAAAPALRYLTEAQLVQRRLGNQASPRLSASLYFYLAGVANQQERLAQAQQHLRRASADALRSGQGDVSIMVLLTSADVLRKQGRYGPARTAAQTGLTEARRANYTQLTLLAYQALAQVSAAAADWPAAYRYQTRFQGLNDSLFTQTKAQQLATLATRYQSQQQEAQISLLQRNTALQQRSRNLLVGGLVVVALMGGASYRRYRRERRFRRQLQAQELELAARNQALTRTEQRLSQSLDEKEVLLKEVHHRVKNNLQVIASRLALQALEQRANPAVTAALRESQNWVKTISLIHEMLYRSDDLASVEFQPFLEQLVAQLGRALAGGGAGEVACTVAAPGVRLGTSTAVPLGLIINELLSNTYKHAFAGGRPGHVAIELGPEAGGYCLRVRDDGTGLPPGFSLDSTASLGLRLVRSLARQLEGHVTATSLPTGTEFCLVFREID